MIWAELRCEPTIVVYGSCRGKEVRCGRAGKGRVRRERGKRCLSLHDISSARKRSVDGVNVYGWTEV